MSTADGNIQLEGAQSEKGCIPAEEHEKKPLPMKKTEATDRYSAEGSLSLT